ncbi:MAG: ribulose-phosphate 3-epimerase [Bacillota bacterium]|jgi:ribulose-phosphate 3-epimerase|nr:ribulose-phosphate 3-epimerase [Bacillota bacterium]NLJ02027.1 ribulose-phosphate 3-epimerase [Bacillota bacterium]
MEIRISPSVLAADLSNLRGELEKVKNADLLHMDVMDGNYVPNITFGMPVITAAKRCSDVPLDIHLMMNGAEHFLAEFASVEPEFITVHYEAVTHLQSTLRKIRDLGIKAGVSLNPHTPLNGLKYILDDLDLIMLMTVNPGFGGQKFIPAMLEKVRDCSELIGDRPIELQVDGGIGVDNLADLIKAGANNFVAGSSIFGAEDPTAYIEQMRAIARQG